MKNIETLVNIILREAPLSSYVKKGVRGIGKTVAALHDPHSSSKSQAFTGTIGKGIQKLGAPSLKDGEHGVQNKNKSTTQQSQAEQLQFRSADYSKAKTVFVINGTQLPSKFAGNTPNGYPIYNIQGIPWAKSIVIEPKGMGKLNVYMYKDKKPNIRKQPVAVRHGSQDFLGVQNKLVITTK